MGTPLFDVSQLSQVVAILTTAKTDIDTVRDLLNAKFNAYPGVVRHNAFRAALEAHTAYNALIASLEKVAETNEDDFSAPPPLP